MKKKPNCMNPGTTLLMKLGSIVVHAEEAISLKGHTWDVEAIKPLLADPEVKAWLEEMDGLAMLPVKR